MPTTYEKADQEVMKLVRSVLEQFETHRPVINAGVKIDVLMAHAPIDPETGKPIGFAIKVRGRGADGQARIVNLKDRSKGMGDAEIILDGDQWSDWSDEEQRSLLDHELHHIAVIVNQSGVVQTDDLGRPKLRLRKHDIEFGWFNIVAARHDVHSGERRQAKEIVDKFGQIYFPQLLGTDTAEFIARKVRTRETVNA